MRLLPAVFGVVLLGIVASGGGAAEPSRLREAPEIHAEAWLNGGPLTLAGLRGRVVLVEFWTFACWNCQNVEPALKRWHARYADQGLVTVAVHTPELSFERDLANVREYVRDKRIPYVVAVDNDFVTWRRYGNRAWPAIYLVDRRGRIRHVRIGEGGYEETEARIRDLLAEEAPEPGEPVPGGPAS